MGTKCWFECFTVASADGSAVHWSAQPPHSYKILGLSHGSGLFYLKFTHSGCMNKHFFFFHSSLDKTTCITSTHLCVSHSRPSGAIKRPFSFLLDLLDMSSLLRRLLLWTGAIRIKFDKTAKVILIELHRISNSRLPQFISYIYIFFSW